MCFVFNSKPLLLPYTTLTDCFYNRDGECLLRGTDWIFKYNITLILKVSNRLGCGLDGPGLESLQGQEFFVFSIMLKPALPSTRLLIKLVSGLERPVRGAVHSPPSCVEVTNEWSYISTPLHTFMA